MVYDEVGRFEIGCDLVERCRARWADSKFFEIALLIYGWVFLRKGGVFCKNVHKLGPLFSSVAMPSVSLRAFLYELAREIQVRVPWYNTLQVFV
jgi:hypothetical protein